MSVVKFIPTIPTAPVSAARRASPIFIRKTRARTNSPIGRIPLDPKLDKAEDNPLKKASI